MNFLILDGGFLLLMLVLLLVRVGGRSVLARYYLTMLKVVINSGTRNHEIIFRCLMVMVQSITSVNVVMTRLHKLLLSLELWTLHNQILVIVTLVIVLIQVLLMSIVFV